MPDLIASLMSSVQSSASSWAAKKTVNNAIRTVLLNFIFHSAGEGVGLWHPTILYSSSYLRSNRMAIRRLPRPVMSRIDANHPTKFPLNRLQTENPASVCRFWQPIREWKEFRRLAAKVESRSRTEDCCVTIS